MNKKQLKDLSNSTFPTNGTRQITAKNLRDYNDNSIESMYLNVGSVIAWAGLSSNIPPNWKLCNGSKLSQADYPDLFNALGGQLSPWGVQNTTFSLPELIAGASPIQALEEGVTGSPELGEMGGESVHVLSVDELPPHTHGINGAIGGSGVLAPVLENSKPWAITTYSTGFGKAHNNMPPYTAMYWIIKIL